VRHPVNGMHLEATYLEWEQGPYKAKGITCQRCHMSARGDSMAPVSGAACAGGPDRNNLFRMTFVGANVAQGVPVESERLLKSAATLKLDLPEVIASGSQAGEVTITNARAGHYLPTGLTEVRQMWLEVTVEGPEGKEVVATRKFGTELADKAGKHPVELWEAEKVFSDDRIPPLESVVSTFQVEIPQGAESAKVQAALYYRSLPDELAKESGVDNPTTVMASAVQGVYTSEEAAAKAAREAADEAAGTTRYWPLALLAAAVVAVVGFVLARRRKKDTPAA
jgi:hypothetical protein